MKAKRFTCQQIRKQEKTIESEDSSSSYKDKRLVEEKEINKSNQVGNLLLKISKQEETIFNLSEQLRSILIQYEVLNEELAQLKTLLITNKHITREQIQLQSQQPSSQVVSMQIENPECQQPFPQVYQQQISSTQADKNKRISERLEKVERILIKRQKSKQSEKDADVVNPHGLQLETVKTLKNFKQEKKKRHQESTQDFEQQEKEFTRRKHFNIKTKSEQVGQTSQQKRSWSPATQNLMGRHNQAEIPEGGKHLF